MMLMASVNASRRCRFLGLYCTQKRSKARAHGMILLVDFDNHLMVVV